MISSMGLLHALAIFLEDITWDAANPSPEKSSAPYRILTLVIANQLSFWSM